MRLKKVILTDRFDLSMLPEKFAGSLAVEERSTKLVKANLMCMWLVDIKMESAVWSPENAEKMSAALDQNVPHSPVNIKLEPGVCLMVSRSDEIWHLIQIL